MIRLVKSEFQRHFDLIEDFIPEYQEWGYKGVQISGRFLRADPDFDDLALRLKAILPKDARLVCWDGHVARMMSYADRYLLVFGSHEWPQVKEGAELPALEPIFLADGAGETVYDMRALGGLPSGVGLTVRVDKRTHRLVIRREDETEEENVVRVEPLEETDAC